MKNNEKIIDNLISNLPPIHGIVERSKIGYDNRVALFKTKDGFTRKFWEGPVELCITYLNQICKYGC